MNKIGVIKFAHDANVYLYENLQIEDVSLSDTDYQNDFEFVCQFIQTLNLKLIKIVTNNKVVYINPDKIMYIKSYMDEQTFSFD